MQLPAMPGLTGRSDHNGGKVAIGLDGNIYVVIGEVGGHQTMAQNVKLHQKANLFQTALLEMNLH